MLRVIKIQNISPETVAIGAPGDEDYREIPPLGSLTLTHAEYIQKAIKYDMSLFDVKILMPNIELKRVSVKDFGAMGDGITDDTETIQSAIDYVSFYGGGVVDLPIGVYIVSGILLDGNVMLQGESKRDSVLKLKADANNAIVSFANSEAGMSKVRLVGDGR